MFKTIFRCLYFVPQASAHYDVFKHTQSLTQDILSALSTTDANDENLVQRILKIIGEGTLAAAAINGLLNALKAETGQTPWQFAECHPVFVAIVVLGFLVILAPRALGFGGLGPLEGWSFFTCM